MYKLKQGNGEEVKKWKDAYEGWQELHIGRHLLELHIGSHLLELHIGRHLLENRSSTYINHGVHPFSMTNLQCFYFLDVSRNFHKISNNDVIIKHSIYL